MEIQIKQNVSLRDYCTYKTGGPARFFAEATSSTSMVALREFANQQKVPMMILGGGSNVLFADEGFPGLIVLNKMGKVHFHGDKVTAESGVNIMQLILMAAELNLGGISAMANVPGSVGGAVYGNAGIPDLWIGNVLLHALILPANSDKPTIVPKEYFEFGYRTSKIKKTRDIVLAATLQLKPQPKAVIKTEIHQYMKTRVVKQPPGPSCGSFFKNPGEYPSAGWLIEQAGCKGLTIGGAQISEKHANFLLNTGTATSADILKVATEVHKRVKEKFGIDLHPEVQIMIPNSPFTNS